MKSRFASIRLVAAMIIVAEICLRASGLVDFPIYELDVEIGYFPKPNQRGAFLNRNDWYFNNKSMPIAQDWFVGQCGILLIGNSIVMGGNPYRQQEKLAPQLQRRLSTGSTIWPIAVGGWTQMNQIAYLRQHPEITFEQNYIAWEYMHGGLSDANAWPGEYVFPSQRPIIATWYVLRRYVVPRILPSFHDNELPPAGGAKSTNVQKFDRALEAMAGRGNNGTRRGIIWLYPTAAQLHTAKLGVEWLPERAQIQYLANKNGMRVVDLTSNPVWNDALYSADGVHPNVEGISALASILVQELRKDGIE